MICILFFQWDTATIIRRQYYVAGKKQKMHYLLQIKYNLRMHLVLTFRSKDNSAVNPDKIILPQN